MGESLANAPKSIGVTEQTYYRWRERYGGLQVSQSKRTSAIEKESARSRKTITYLMLDQLIFEQSSRTLRAAQQKLLIPSRKRQAVEHVKISWMFLTGDRVVWSAGTTQHNKNHRHVDLNS